MRARDLGQPAAPTAPARRAGAVGTRQAAALALQRTAGNRATASSVAGPCRRLLRVVEFRPPGRGEASAFDRREELLDRINRQTPGVVYSLDGRVLEYFVLDEAAVQNFDRKMMEFIDLERVLPMRLITNEGLVGGSRLLIDALEAAYVDIDDMLACSDVSFQLNLIHFLEERAAVRNYERRIGTDMSGDFPRAHRAGLQSEAEHLRAVVGDPTIEFVFEENQGNGRIVFGFRSRAERYRIFHIFSRGRNGVQGGRMSVRTRDGRTITLEELIAERNAAAAPVPVPAGP